MIFNVRYKETLEKFVVAIVEADSEQEAIEKAKEGDVIDTDENESYAEVIDINNYEIVKNP
jgi:hypothetical protein